MRLWDGAGTAPLPLGCEQHLAATQALRGGRLQPEPWPLGSVPADASGQLSPFAPALPALFPSSSGYSEMCLGLGASPFPMPRAPHGTVQTGSTLLPLVLAPRCPLLPRRGFLCKRCLLLSFSCLRFLYAGDEMYLALWGLCCPCNPSTSSRVPSVHLPVTP